VLLAFVLVELAALAIPAWRRLRTGGAEGRARLAEPIAVVALLFALMQGWLLTRWLQSVRPFSAELMEPGLLPAGLVTISLVGGTLVLVILAAVVSRWGVVNGYSLILVAPLASRPINYVLGQFNMGNPGHVGFLGMMTPEPPTMFHRVIELGLYAGVALLTIWCLRRRARSPDGPSLRLPAAGLVPLYAGGALIGIVAHHYTAHVVLIAFLAAGLAVLFALPLPSRGGGSALAFAAVTAVLYALAVDFAHQTATRLPHTFFSAIEVAVLTAVACDVLTELIARHRLGPLVDVWPLHQVHDADGAAAALAAAGIPCHLRSTGHRSLLHLFGPFVPVSILVPVDRAQAAIDVLRVSLSTWPPKQS
jgi:hypothetical protein